MRKAVGAFLGALGLLGAALWMMRDGGREYEARDAIQVIAAEVDRLLRENPAATPDDIDRAILWLGRASVIHVEAGSDGRPVDPYGAPFRVRREVTGPESVTTAASAGRDRRWGTEDDLVETVRRPRAGD